MLLSKILNLESAPYMKEIGKYTPLNYIVLYTGGYKNEN